MGAGQPGGPRCCDPEPGCAQEEERILTTLAQLVEKMKGEEGFWRILAPFAKDARSTELPLTRAGALEEEILCSFSPQTLNAFRASSLY